MSPRQALQAARLAGVEVRLEESNLLFVAADWVPADILDALRQQKAAIVELLRAEGGKSAKDPTGRRLTFGDLMEAADEDAEEDDDEAGEDDWDDEESLVEDFDTLVEILVDATPQDAGPEDNLPPEGSAPSLPPSRH